MNVSIDENKELSSLLVYKKYIVGKKIFRTDNIGARIKSKNEMRDI